MKYMYQKILYDTHVYDTLSCPNAAQDPILTAWSGCSNPSMKYCTAWNIIYRYIIDRHTYMYMYIETDIEIDRHRDRHTCTCRDKQT